MLLAGTMCEHSCRRWRNSPESHPRTRNHPPIPPVGAKYMANIALSILSGGISRAVEDGRVVRALMVIVTLCMSLFILYQLAPFFDPNASLSRATISPEYRDAQSKAAAGVTKRGDKATSQFEYPASELTNAVIQVEANGGENRLEYAQSVKSIRIRPDRVILWTGTIAVLIAIFMVLLPSISRLREDPFEATIRRVERVNREAAQKEPTTTPKLTPIDLFATEVDSAARRADALFIRSTLLLAGGIIMAFIGVGIFYVTLPETKGDQTLLLYWPKVVRPTGVLIFVEAISWFLLRQYRALVEDYKWFYRLYLKRANYLAALRILDTKNVRAEDAFVAVSLIREDYSGRLRAGETTESIETLKLPEESPITEALRAFSSIKDKIKPEKPKGKSEKDGA
jgi:hypothetical protein